MSKVVMTDGLGKKYPDNSSAKTNKKKTEKPKVEAVVKSKVTRRRKPLGKRIASTFINEESGNIGSYVLEDVIIPGAKNMIYDIVQNSLGIALFGSAHHRGSNSKRGGIFNYNSISKNKASGSAKSNRTISNRNRATHNFDEIVIDDRAEANYVLEQMDNLIERFDQVSVGDLYDLLGVTSSFTDRNYGWTNISKAKVIRDRAGYMLDLPPTEVLR